MSENLKTLVDGLRDAHLADPARGVNPPVAGPPNSPDIARICEISNRQNGSPDCATKESR